MKNLVYKLYKSLWLHKKIVVGLVCILISLMYLQGEHYVHCRCPHPDVLMDMQRSISPCISKDEQTIYSESMGNIPIFSLVDIRIVSIYDVYTVKPSFSLECFHFRDPKERLHILQRYNS